MASRFVRVLTENCRRRFVAALVRRVLFLSVVGVTVAVAAPIDRRDADTRFEADLSALAKELAEAGLSESSTAVLDWFVPRAVDRSYYFLGDLAVVSAEDVLQGEADRWVQPFQAARDRQAERLWELAETAGGSDDPSSSVPLLYEVLHEQPASRRARKALGLPLKKPTSATGLLGGQPRTARNPQQAYGWEAGKYWRLQTDHFLITTNHSGEAAEPAGPRAGAVLRGMAAGVCRVSVE